MRLIPANQIRVSRGNRMETHPTPTEHVRNIFFDSVLLFSNLLLKRTESRIPPLNLLLCSAGLEKKKGRAWLSLFFRLLRTELGEMFFFYNSWWGWAFWEL